MSAVLLAAMAAIACAQSVRDDFDCRMRSLAVQFAEEIQPFRWGQTFLDLADALDGTPEKAAGCSVRDSAAVRGAAARAAASPARASRFPLLHGGARAPGPGGGTFYVAVNGSNANPGTQAAPFATLAAALAASRATAGWDTILLRGGDYMAMPTTVLGAADSGLTIQNFPGEEVWLSGAVPLKVNWQPHNVSNGTLVWEVFPDTSTIFGGNGFPVDIVAGVASAGACQALCAANHSAGGPCATWTWHSPYVEPQYRLQCWLRLDGVWSPTVDANHTSGRLTTGPNIYKADLSGTGVAAVPGLRAGHGPRLQRAQFPNYDRETKGMMPPGVFRAAWTPQQSKRAPDVEVNLPPSQLSRNTTVSYFQVWTGGVGGTCERFQPSAGYWCSTKVQGGGSVIYYVPGAMQAGRDVLPHTPYANATGAIVQTWRPGHWASWMYEVGAAVFNGSVTNFTFSKGGFQGSRGEDSGEDTYIENVFEELDEAGEFFYNATESTLYLWWNASAPTPPPGDGTIAATATKWLFNITGSMAAPVHDISIVGLGMRDTAYTYMDPHSLPSGGDWAMERSAVVFIEGAERVTVSGCIFERIDGNAIMLSAYTRNVTIYANEFAWIGSTAVASWGNTAPTAGADSVMPYGYGADGTNGDQPRYNTISHNLCRELGIYEKQSSFYTQFKSGYNHVFKNVVYNGPRAHLNHNDGFAGGTVHESNLILNSCRESGDHGPFNSWDRDPSLIIDPETGAVTTTKAFDILTKNFIIANYNSLGAVDNDDGSSYYKSISNFFVYGGGGLKNDFEGHDNYWIENVIAFPGGPLLHNGYGGKVGDPGKGYINGHEDCFISNIGIVEYENSYAKPICADAPGTTIMNNSRVFSPKGQLTTDCGATFDVGAVYAPYTPTMASDIIGWARAALAF